MNPFDESRSGAAVSTASAAAGTPATAGGGTGGGTGTQVVTGPGYRHMGWIVGGILLGLLNTFAVATYAALGVSRNYAVVDSMVLKAVGSDLPQTNTYLSTRIPTTPDWLLMLVIGMVAGGFLAALVRGGLTTRAVPRLWASRFGNSKLKRFAAAFVGGFLLLYGARIAGGCTSGLVLSGVAQLALAGFVFGATILGTGILTAKLLYRRAQ